MSKTITLRVSEDHYEAFKQYAKRENRKISNAIETLALKQLENVQFADELEMEGDPRGQGPGHKDREGGETGGKEEGPVR